MTIVQKAALVADAKNRALRTFLVSLAVDVGMALAVLLVQVFSAADSWDDVDWKILGFLLVKTVIISAGAYVLRRFLDPSAFPTPLPPAPVPPPADPTP